MAEPRFDVQFAGELLPGADLLAVSERLCERFKLSPGALERLFSGQPMVVKRDLDASTAARYRDVFRAAGALAYLTESPNAEPPAIGAPAAPASDGRPGEAPPAAAQGPLSGQGPAAEAGAELSLAPPGANVEEVVPQSPPVIDTAGLSLVPGQDWTLEDCAQALGAVLVPDISHLSLVPAEPVAGDRMRDSKE